jgi:hypothetical protein
VGNITILELYVGESRYYWFNFAHFPELSEDAQTLTGTPTVTADVGGLTLGSAFLSGSKVLVLISGGSPNVLYQLTATCSVSGGGTLIVPGKLRVLSP